jgi:hypothetical protein
MSQCRKASPAKGLKPNFSQKVLEASMSLTAGPIENAPCSMFAPSVIADRKEILPAGKAGRLTHPTTPGRVLVVILSGDFAVVMKNHSFVGAIQGSKPNSLPSCTACVRRLAPSLSKTRLEWVLTVFSLT